MTVTIRLFAILRDKAGVAEMPLKVSEGATVAEAMELILRQHPELTPIAKRVAFAVNLTRVHAEMVLKDGDELALLPPVSGG
jgi:molybdopterin converting factor subunit 1